MMFTDTYGTVQTSVLANFVIYILLSTNRTGIHQFHCMKYFHAIAVGLKVISEEHHQAALFSDGLIDEELASIELIGLVRAAIGHGTDRMETCLASPPTSPLLHLTAACDTAMRYFSWLFRPTKHAASEMDEIFF